MSITASKTAFTQNGVNVGGYLARPDSKDHRAAVIIVHEWYGLNRHLEDVAERYAKEGYLAFAIDLYDGVLAKDDSEAAAMMSALDQTKTLNYLKAAVSHLRSQPGIERVGVTGFCMGGSFALLLPCETKLDAAAPFYGDVPEDTSFISRLSCPLLFIGAEKDEWITIDKMKRLEAAIKKYEKDGEVVIYKNAPHAFFNDTREKLYRPDDAADAWRRVLDFFGRHLGQ
jgi:carboxymethylenebutenolidase